MESKEKKNGVFKQFILDKWIWLAITLGLGGTYHIELNSIGLYDIPFNMGYFIIMLIVFGICVWRGYVNAEVKEKDGK